MKIDRALFHPDYKAEPFWWEAARPVTEHSSDLPDKTEVFIVGSGYSGLSAALELARGGRSVTVVDALAFGEGASTRSGGGVSAGVNIGKGIAGGPGQAKHSGAHKQLIERLMSESLAAYEFVHTLVEREGIECHFERRGRFIGANTPTHFVEFQKKADDLNRVLQIGARLLAKDEQRSEIGSDYYHGGIVIEHAAKLHPSLFHKGLLDACHRIGVTLCAHTKVEKIDGALGNFSIKTTKGYCQAEQVIVATNGYTGALSPNLRKRIVPIFSQIITTEELPEDLALELIPNGRTISESARITNYYRLLPGDRRVMFGGRARFESVPADVSAAILHGKMIDRWPQLKGVRITHSWSGLVAMTTDSIPHMGQEDGLHFCTGCNGSGVAMMTYLGNQVAQRILQDGQSDSAYVGVEFPKVPVPFYSGNPWFLPIIGNYYRLLDRTERRKIR
jgi:glycine/D-amino acid oxidase-like deaminating enzyme